MRNLLSALGVIAVLCAACGSVPATPTPVPIDTAIPSPVATSTVTSTASPTETETPAEPTPTLTQVISYTPTITSTLSPASALACTTEPRPSPTRTATRRPAISLGDTETPDPFAMQRDKMVELQIVARDVTDPDILDAMRTVPRHEFVLERYLDQAYADHPLPIDYGQTISQPYIVALMTEKTGVKRGDKVLDVGTGSGYQAAILAQLGAEVYSIEIIPELAESATERLKRLGYDVATTQGDGYFGWEEHAPFDAIIVAAAPDHVPQPLALQLKDGGRLVIPVGPQGSYQTLWQFGREGDELEAVNLGGVAFVPLTGEH
jgi:protein-L-isoaspartate(D-aspartate) O-methyltransferase